MLPYDAKHPVGVNPPPRRDVSAEEFDDALAQVAAVAFEETRWHFLPFLPQKENSKISPDLPLGKQGACGVHRGPIVRQPTTRSCPKRLNMQ